MKKHWMIPITAILGGAAAFVLRLIHMRTGFEAGTGLPIPGNFAGAALVVLLAVLAVLLVVLTRQLPKEEEPGPGFPGNFSTSNPQSLTLPVMGVFLIALSGTVDLLEGAGVENLLWSLRAAALPDPHTPSSVLHMDLYAAPAFSAKAQLLMGLLALLSAAGLFLNLLACRRRDGEAPRAANGNLLLILPVNLVVRLVMTYRIDSVNPALSAYYVELLALVFLTLGFYRLSSFAFRAGQTRRFALYAGAAVIFSIAALADSTRYFSSILLYAGGALALQGLLLLCLAPRTAGERDA